MKIANQASEDELMRELGFRYEPSEGGYYIHKFVKNPENPSSLNSVLVPEVAKQIQSHIRTEKRLYAESVIGEDEATAGYSYLPATLDEMTKSAHEKSVRNQLRAEQRARIK